MGVLVGTVVIEKTEKRDRIWTEKCTANAGLQHISISPLIASSVE